MKQQAQLRRTFLFLQGPHGSFFPKLGEALRGAGHAVFRINLNGGDRATWPSGANFAGTDKAWPDYVSRFITREGITDLILFGDSRPQHAEAVRIARGRGLRIHVFEEGYIRPDWVTLERDGVNGHSLLSRDPEWYREQARGLAPVPRHPAVPSYSAARGWAAFFYYAEVVLQTWRFPFHGSHRPSNPVREGIQHLIRGRYRDEEATRARAGLARLTQSRYFLFPLQLDSDYQIRVHSPFGTMPAAIEHVLANFARHAPADILLVVKEHPLDGGMKNWRSIVGEIAARNGIGERIVFLEQGELLSLVQGSLGMVTVNSTSGTLSLASGRPVKVLGDAVYNIAGITHQAPLDTFWAAPTPPDPATYDDFYRVLVDRCLIHGAFLSNAGIDLLVEAATRRLTATEQADVTATAAAPHG
ncbi:MAG TPA: capsular biosynthesis protein [Sphingomonas sp.]